MSIFGRMFRRGGPRDPDDPGDDGDDGDETAQPGAQRDEPVPMANPPRGSGPDGTTLVVARARCRALSLPRPRGSERDGATLVAARPR